MCQPRSNCLGWKHQAPDKRKQQKQENGAHLAGKQQAHFLKVKGQQAETAS